MQLRALVSILMVCVVPLATQAADLASKPVEVMVVGVFHMSNPGHDIHNLKVDDVLEPKRQGEIAAVTAALASFKPTKVGVEWAADVVADRYKQYLAGTLPASRNEVVQLGFRLAKTTGAEGVYGLDADGDFPYERLQNFAETRGFKGLLDEQNAIIQRSVDQETRLLADKSVAADLRFLNDPEQIKADNGFYRSMLRIGLNSDQPGVDLMSACQPIAARQAGRPGRGVFRSGPRLLVAPVRDRDPGLQARRSQRLPPGMTACGPAADLAVSRARSRFQPFIWRSDVTMIVEQPGLTQE
jgi:hypothetical protein